MRAVHDDAVFLANEISLAELVAKNRIPSTGNKEFAEAGGLIGYGVNFIKIFRRAAYFVDKILKGAKPADLPVEQRTKFELVINLNTANALGITIPPSIMVRADEILWDD
jgi:putative ABC transport system substrate-binding protein